MDLKRDISIKMPVCILFKQANNDSTPEDRLEKLNIVIRRQLSRGYFDYIENGLYDLYLKKRIEKRSEKRNKNSLPYKKKQELYWKSTHKEQILIDLLLYLKTKRNTKTTIRR